jgi:hypothetical protein
VTADISYQVFEDSMVLGEHPLSSGRFKVGSEHSLLSTEKSAKARAIEYAVKLSESNYPVRFVVRRITDEVVWGTDAGDRPSCPDCGGATWDAAGHYAPHRDICPAWHD